MHYDHEGICNLLAAVWRLAWTEARRGDAGAIHFLDRTVPTWREWERRRQLRQAKEAAMQWDHDYQQWDDELFEAQARQFTSKGSIENDSKLERQGKSGRRKRVSRTPRRAGRAQQRAVVHPR